jgi:hypothetical protein
MKYKAGDIVRIRSKEWFDRSESAYSDESISLTSTMRVYAGKTARITKVSGGCFHISIDPDDYWWASWMFDPDYSPSDEPLPAKDAIRAMLDGETLHDKEGREWRWDEFNCLFGSPGTNDILSMFDGLCLRPVKHKRLMTHWEILDWANSDASRGWVVVQCPEKPSCDTKWNSPQYYGYDGDDNSYWKARLLPDLSGIDESTIQKLEVEE